MGIKQVPIDPGTPGVAVYWPFKVTHLDGDFVSVNPGELFYDPLIGGEIVDIKGVDVPFRVNESSLIYLQVFFDMVGRVTHAGIAHTGKHLDWLLPGEKWLNYPRMYAVNDLPFFGIAAAGEYGMQTSTAGYWPMVLHSCGRNTGMAGLPQIPACNPATGTTGTKDWRLEDEGWFAEVRQEGEGWGIRHGGAKGWGVNPNYSVGIGALPGGARNGVDGELTCVVGGDPAAKRVFATNQIYTGIDRELRKDICTQGVNVSNPYRRQYPWNLKDVGRYPNPGTNPGNGALVYNGIPHPGKDFTWRRQKMGSWDKSTVPWKALGRGWDEYGGYMNVGVGVLHGGAPKGAPINPRAGAQYLSYVMAHHKIQKGWAKHTTKLHRTAMDQCMAFYPIAYAARPSRQLQKGYVNGITIPAAEYGPYPQSPNTVHKRREFQIFQACKTHLRLATILEGDAKFKAIVPYTGMHTSIPVYEGDLTQDWLNFVQKWKYHAGGWNGVGGINRAYTGPPFSNVRGSHYYRRVNGHDLPFNQTYLDALFNNQSPS